MTPEEENELYMFTGWDPIKKEYNGLEPQYSYAPVRKISRKIPKVKSGTILYRGIIVPQSKLSRVFSDPEDLFTFYYPRNKETSWSSIAGRVVKNIINTHWSNERYEWNKTKTTYEYKEKNIRYAYILKYVVSNKDNVIDISKYGDEREFIMLAPPTNKVKIVKRKRMGKETYLK